MTFPVAIGHRRRPGAGARPGHQPLGHLDLGRPASPAWTARPPRASRSSWRRRSPPARSSSRRASSLTGEAGVDRRARAARRRAWSRRSSPGLLAIRFLLRYLRTHSLDVFVAYRLRARGDRRSSSGWRGRRGATMEVMKQLRQRAIRDLVDQRPIRTQQELAAALRERGFRTTQATISRDVAELGLDQGHAARAPPPTRCRRASSRPRPPARTACASSCPTCRSRSTRPGCCSSCARCRARPTRSRRRSTGRAGPRSRARSPATTRCSWRCRTVARCSGSSAVCSVWPRVR